MSKIGIVSYGSYIPRYRIKIEDIANVWQEDSNEVKTQLQVNSKSVLGPDEDGEYPLSESDLEWQFEAMSGII